MRSGAWRALPWVTGGNALGLELYRKCCLEGSTPEDWLFFFQHGLERIKRIRRIGLVSFPQAYALAARWWCSSMQASLPAWTSPPVWSAVVRRKGIKSRMLPRGQESVRLLFNSSQRTGVAFVMTVLLWCPASGRICVSLSEGNAKTGLEQIPVTYSRKACGPHKSTFTTPRKSVKSVLSVQIRV